MHRESQVVKIDSVGVFGIVTEVHAHMCKVKYFWLGLEFEEYFEIDEIEVIGEIGYEVE